MKLVAFCAIIGLVLLPIPAGSDPAQQRYVVGTSADDAWQSGVAPQHINAYSAPVGGNCRNYYDASTSSYSVLSSGYRFENVQLDQGATVSDARLSLELSNDQYGGVVTEFRSPITVELSATSNDFSYQKDIINRARSTVVATWDTFPADASLGNVAYTSSPNLAGAVNQVLALPGWHRGGSITVLVIGEVYAPGSEEETEYAHAYGWTAYAWDCHGLPPQLTLQPAA